MEEFVYNAVSWLATPLCCALQRKWIMSKTTRLITSPVLLLWQPQLLWSGGLADNRGKGDYLNVYLCLMSKIDMLAFKTNGFNTLVPKGVHNRLTPKVLWEFDDYLHHILIHKILYNLIDNLSNPRKIFGNRHVFRDLTLAVYYLIIFINDKRFAISTCTLNTMTKIISKLLSLRWIV